MADPVPTESSGGQAHRKSLVMNLIYGERTEVVMEEGI